MCFQLPSRLAAAATQDQALHKFPKGIYGGYQRGEALVGMVGRPIQSADLNVSQAVRRFYPPRIGVM